MALTEQKRRYAAARLSGLGKKASALEAGCPEKTASQAASRYEKDPDVLALMARTVAVEESKQEKPAGGVDAHIPAAADDPLEFFKSMMNNLRRILSFALMLQNHWLPTPLPSQVTRARKRIRRRLPKRRPGASLGLHRPRCMRSSKWTGPQPVRTGPKGSRTDRRSFPADLPGGGGPCARHIQAAARCRSAWQADVRRVFGPVGFRFCWCHLRGLRF